MRLLITTSVFFPSVGGIESLARLLAHEFACQGHGVTVLTQTSAAGLDNFSFKIERRPSWLRVWHCVADSEAILQFGGVRLGWPMLILKRKSLTVHENWPDSAHREKLTKRMLRRMWIARSTNVCPSMAFQRLSPFPCEVVPNPYDDGVFRPTPQVARDRDIVFLGRLVPEKGLDVLINAVGMLAQRGLRPDVTVVGSGPHQEVCQARAKALGLESQLRFLGVARGEQLARILNQHRLMVVPSTWSEPFGIVALEGIACGCVVVGSSGGGLPEAVGECGVTFPNGNAAALADILFQLLRDNDLLCQDPCACGNTLEQLPLRCGGAQIPSVAGVKTNFTQTKTISSTPARLLVVQNGSRHNYAVPAVLARAGMLEAFYTDVCADVGMGKWLAMGRHLPVVGRRFLRLYDRRLPEGVVRKTKSFAATVAYERLAARFFGVEPHARCVGQRMIRSGFGMANLIYSSLGWATPFLAEARSQGIKVVTEFYVRPSLWKTYQAEHLAFPDWEPIMPLPRWPDLIGTSRDPCTVSDFVIVPSANMIEDVANTHDFPRERIRVIPYGVSGSFFQIQNKPSAGRILFAGSCSLIKGIHYFAMASERLRQRGFSGEFRVAGQVTEGVRNQPVCRHLTFLGRLSRFEMSREYASADMLVFPTLSDSFGMVLLEAMAAGIPVICSPYCAQVVEDGANGFVVEPREVEKFAARIEQIRLDRALRERMGREARERTREYTWEHYGARLVNVLNNLSK